MARWSRLLLVLTLYPSVALSQGATGGSFGNDNKSLSGSTADVDKKKPKRTRVQATSEKRAPSVGNAGGVSRFNGTWTAVLSPGCLASRTMQLVVSNGVVTGPLLSGTVSSAGVVRTTGSALGLTVVSSGRIMGNTGSGTFRQSNGCTGTVRAVRN